MQTLSSPITIKTYIAKGIIGIFTVKCDVEDCLDDHKVNYNPNTGELSIQTSHTSEFRVICKEK